MKLVHSQMGHILTFNNGCVNELIIENKKMFLKLVNDINIQSEGLKGDFILSIKDKPVEFSKYTDVTMQFAPFHINRKTLLTKLCSALEQKALLAENYVKTGEILSELEAYIIHLAEDFSFEIDCQRIAIGPILRAVSPEIEENNKSTLEKVFEYMEMVRELDKERLFIMINMRTYFTDNEMKLFIESVCLHDFKLLLVESTAFNILPNTKRYVIDEDLCEF